MARYTENFVPPQGYLSSRMASFAIDATTFNSTDTPATLDIGARDRLGEDTLGDGHVQVTFKENYTINSTAYMIPIPEIKPFITVIIILLWIAAASALILLPAIFVTLEKWGIGTFVTTPNVGIEREEGERYVIKKVG